MKNIDFSLNLRKPLSNYTFSKLGMNYQDYVKVDQKYMRPEELDTLKGDCTKAKNELNWKHRYTFETMLDEMIDYWLKFYGV